MSKIDVEYGLKEMLKSKDRAVVLFYASWCPFSQKFLPVFEKTDDKASLCEEYSIDVVPTVIVFEKGKVSKRLDGEPGAGLKEKQLKGLISTP